MKARALVPSTFVGELKTEMERIIEMEALQQAQTEVERILRVKGHASWRSWKKGTSKVEGLRQQDLPKGSQGFDAIPR